MKKYNIFWPLSIAIISLSMSACTTNPYTGESEVSKTAIGAGIGTAAGAAIGILSSSKNDRAKDARHWRKCNSSR